MLFSISDMFDWVKYIVNDTHHWYNYVSWNILISQFSREYNFHLSTHSVVTIIIYHSIIYIAIQGTWNLKSGSSHFKLNVVLMFFSIKTPAVLNLHLIRTRFPTQCHISNRLILQNHQMAPKKLYSECIEGLGGWITEKARIWIGWESGQLIHNFIPWQTMWVLH